MALPYTLDLTGSGRGSILAADMQFGSGSWSATLPAARYVGSADETIYFDVDGGGGIGGPSRFTLRVGGDASGGEDLTDELEEARLLIQSADGSTEYWRGVLRDIDPVEPYVWYPGEAATAALLTGQGSGQSTIRLYFEQAEDPIDADIGTVSAAAPTARLSAEVREEPVDAEIGGVSAGAPSAQLSAEPAWDPVDARIAAAAPAPSARLDLGIVSADPIDADIGTVSSGAPSASVSAGRAVPTARNARIGTVSAGAPSAALSAEPASDPVDARIAAAAGAPSARLSAEPHIESGHDAEIGTVSAAAPSAVLRAVRSDLFVDARIGAVSAGAPTASLRAAGILGNVDVRIAARAEAPVGSVRVAAGSAREDFAGDERASQPRERILTCVEFSHPAIAAPARLVNDTEDRVVEGQTYTATRFEAKLADDAKRRAPRAEIAVGNVGRVLHDWVERSGGGAGGTARIFQVIDIPGAIPEWDLELDIVGIAGDSANVTVSLGFDPLLGRPAVALRYDPQTAPGLF